MLFLYRKGHFCIKKRPTNMYKKPILNIKRPAPELPIFVNKTNLTTKPTPVLFQKISSHRSKTIYKYTRFQTNTAMQNIRLNINAVTGFHYLLLISYRKFKFSTCHISCLCMIMSMRGSYSSFFKLHFHQHHLSVISHNLTSNTRTCRFPCLFLPLIKVSLRVFSYRFTGCLAVPFLCSIYSREHK